MKKIEQLNKNIITTRPHPEYNILDKLNELIEAFNELCLVISGVSSTKRGEHNPVYLTQDELNAAYHTRGCICPPKKNDGSTFDGVYGCPVHGR